jgi:predicted hotdog family 3-hydroxylacyl-ACP dehydratase
MHPTFQPIEDYVPHRRGLLLIDRVLAADDDSALCELTVRDGLFADADATVVPAWVGIEYMAQAIAAWAGVKHARHGSQPRPGFLLGSRRYLAHVSAFPFGQRLHVSVTCELLGDNGLGMFECAVLDALTGHPQAEARVSVYEQPQNPPPGSDGKPMPMPMPQTGKP